MRNFLLTAISVLYLFTNTQLAEVLKMPRLIHHYRQHQTINPDVSFGSFLVMHYAGDDGTTADDDEDMQLPFRNVNKYTFNLLYSFANSYTDLIEPVPAVEINLYSVKPNGKILSRHGHLIFQPPRPC